MKRARFLLLSIVSLTLLMNFPASGLIPGGSAAETIATASPFFASEDADVIGVFENGDLAAWSSINPGKLLDRKPINGLLSGEKINTIETIPDSASLNSISDHLEGLSISGISNLGNLPYIYNFAVTSGPNNGVAGTGTTDANRKGTFNYTSNSQSGIDTVLVTALVDSKPFSAISKVEWTDGPIIERVSRSGKHVIIDGFFKRGDMVDINGEMANKVKYRDCDGNDNCRQLFLKKAFRLLNENPCINNVARSNFIRVYRNPLGGTAPPIQDTSAFATCP